MLVILVRGVLGSRRAVLGASYGALLLNKDVGDEVVDHRGADGSIRPGPEDDARRGQYFESVEHDELRRNIMLWMSDG